MKENEEKTGQGQLPDFTDNTNGGYFSISIGTRETKACFSMRQNGHPIPKY